MGGFVIPERAGRRGALQAGLIASASGSWCADLRVLQRRWFTSAESGGSRFIQLAAEAFSVDCAEGTHSKLGGAPNFESMRHIALPRQTDVAFTCSDGNRVLLLQTVTTSGFRAEALGRFP